MKFNNFTYIFLGPDLDYKKDRAVIKKDNFTFTTVGIAFAEKDKVVEVAKEMVAQGAQIIELCGGVVIIFASLEITILVNAP